jgi:CheY-like chemotaxis protein
MDVLHPSVRQEQKMEAIGTLAGGIAHDFNNILAAIIGHAELLAQDLPADPQLREGVAGILSASQRARDLVQQILTFSRRREQQRRPMALQPVVLEALRLLRATLPTTIEIRTEIATDQAVVLADPTQIHQVVVNLCTNGAHAMRARGGVLSVSYGRMEVDQPFASAHAGLRPGPYVRMTVSDTGHGMDGVTLERIFDPFFTTKAPGEGTGLGLAVVHGIMQNHEGLVTVESQPGRGSLFNLYFPAAGGGMPVEETREGPLPGGRGEHILVVDDEPAVVEVASRLLTRLGYRVTGHTSPARAMAELRRDPAAFDLVLCDLTMPELTGTELAGQLRTLRPELPVVLTSGYSGSLDQDELQALGIRELLSKPFLLQALAETIRRNLTSAA